MANRRTVLQGAIALSALPLVTKLSPASAGNRARLSNIVYDRQFAASVAFARELQVSGSEIHAITGDMTDLWYGDLHDRWRMDRVAIAGLTTHGPLFCFERLGWDHGLRLTYRAEHIEG